MMNKPTTKRILFILGCIFHPRGEALSLNQSPPPLRTHNHKNDISIKQQQDPSLSRRSAMMGILSKTTTAAVIISPVLGLPIITPEVAYASTNDDEPPNVIARSNLLNAIKTNKPQEQVIAAMNELIPYNPSATNNNSNSESSSSWLQDLDGEWKLIWSANDDFSPLLNLPKPFKPDSYQYFGSAAAKEVGEGRVAQGLTGGIFGNSRQLWLSSGIQQLDPEHDPYKLEIEPPFRLQWGGRYNSSNSVEKQLIVEAGNDQDFRKLNARNEEAQLAGKNVYEQLYVERSGKGSLRISMITDGDPVIVGAILIHEKL